MDNTLIASDKAHTEAYNYALGKLGYEKKDPRVLISLFGGPKMNIAKTLLPKGKSRDWEKLLDLHNQYLIKESCKYAKAIPGAKQALRKLKKQHSIALVSNAHHNNIKSLLKATNFDESLFDVIIGYNDVKHSKPKPDEIFTAEKLIHHKASIMVGDSIYDIVAGKKANVKTVAVLTGNYSKKKLSEYKPDRIIKSVKELPYIIKKHRIIE